MHKSFYYILTIGFVVHVASSAPTKAPESNSRKMKSLGYYDYLPPGEEGYYNYPSEVQDYVIDDNDLSRTIPGRKRLQPRPQEYNSPIYYIRLPPQPYMYVSGLGYVSQPPTPPSPISPFVNLPVSFVSNGKPASIYQWDGRVQFPTPPPPIYQVPETTKKPILDSTIHKLPGEYAFNGKPDDIFVLRDSYNTLYGDALQNFYP